MPDVAITELLEIDPDRVDAVTSPANGTEWLILKSLDGSETVTDTEGVLAEIAKTDAESSDDKRPDCTTCKGSGKIMDGHRKCPKCQGSGVQPQPGDTEKSLAELAAIKESGVAASGADVPVADKCAACGGSGTDSTGQCDSCGGTGKSDGGNDLNTVDADAGNVSVGDSKNRETVDKAAQSTADQNDLPDSAFAYIEKGGKLDADGKTTPRSLRHFPIQDAAHVRNALARASQSPFGDQAMPAIKAAAKKFDIEVSDDAAKADGSVFSAPNPALAAAASQVTDDASGDDDADTPTLAPGAPGSPEWEAVDAQTATDACMALMAAAELIRTFAAREQTEVAMGEGNDVFDAYAATQALCGVSDALGVMSQLAFHEGLEAAKSLADEDDEVVIKAGRRLAGKTVAALAAARDKAKDLADHIGGVLGDDDPKKNASKSADEIDMDALSKEIENMSTDELTKVLDARDEKLVGILAEAFKANAPTAEPAKKAKKDKASAEAVKAEDEDADEAEAADDDAVAEPADDAAKAELTPEEIEANEAAKTAKKALKAAKNAKKEAAENAAVAKAIEEAVAKATTAVDSLKEQLAAAEKSAEDRDARLATVEKMAAPSAIVRTRPQDAINKSAERDALDLELAKYERLAKSHEDMNYRRECNERAKALRVKIAGIGS
jgi:hypothetical protein